MTDETEVPGQIARIEGSTQLAQEEVQTASPPAWALAAIGCPRGEKLPEGSQKMRRLNSDEKMFFYAQRTPHQIPRDQDIWIPDTRPTGMVPPGPYEAQWDPALRNLGLEVSREVEARQLAGVRASLQRANPGDYRGEARLALEQDIERAAQDGGHFTERYGW